MNNALNLPWKAYRHVDVLCSVLYIKNCKGEEVCTFYGNFEESASVIKHILQMCNPKAVEAKVVAETDEIHNF